MSQNELRTKSEIEKYLELCRQNIGHYMKSGQTELKSYWEGRISALHWILKQEE